HRVITANDASIRLAEVDQWRDQERHAGDPRVPLGSYQRTFDRQVHAMHDVEASRALGERARETGNERRQVRDTPDEWRAAGQAVELGTQPMRGPEAETVRRQMHDREALDPDAV